MKKLKCFLLAVIFVITFCSCSPQNTVEVEMLYNEERLEYDIAPTDINLYEGNLYTAQHSKLNGQQISVFDGTGEKIREFTLNGALISEWDIADSRIYVVDDSGWGDDRRMTLYYCDISTGEAEEICDFKSLRYAPKIRAVDDKLYWLGQKEETEIFNESLETNDNELIVFNDFGNIFGCVDLNTGKITEIDIPHPIHFSERNGQIIVYAYEEGKGYCFYDYTADSVVCYTNKLGYISDFEIINDNLDFVFIHNGDKSLYCGTLSFSGIDEKSGVIQLDDEIYPTRLSAEGDYLCIMATESFYSDFNTNKVYKYLVNISTADPPIRVITGSGLTQQTPLFSCGYQIKTDLLSQDSFSLTVLSLDKEYDMAMLSSSESYADEIRNKGRFYPLNDIPGVKEYIDSCFPGIKEAAIDKNGDIWMLPVSVDIPVMRYNEKNCAEKGISFPAELSAFIGELNKASDSLMYCYCSNYYIIQSMLNSYLSENDSFDTDTFRGFASTLMRSYNNKIFKNDNNKVSSAFYNNMLLKENGRGLPDSERYKDIYDKALFALTPFLTDQTKSVGDENLRAAALPSANGKNNAYCTFVCVNPNSEHLAETLLFIERTVSRFANKKNGFTLNDKSMYDDDPYTQSLFEIYANCEISFTMPWEIYQNDFESYTKGVLGLDEFIAEADRKLSAYLNE